MKEKRVTYVCPNCNHALPKGATLVRAKARHDRYEKALQEIRKHLLTRMPNPNYALALADEALHPENLRASVKEG